MVARIAVVTGVLISLFVFLGWAVVSAADEDGPGKAGYDKYCVKCHGAEGLGDTKVGKMMKTPDLSVRPWKGGEKLADVVRVIADGEGKMPGYTKKMKKEEIEAVAKYTLKLMGIDH